MEKLNKDLNNLYVLIKEVKNNIPKVELNDEWKNLFDAIEELELCFEDVADENDDIPMIYNVEIIFEAVGDEDDLKTMYNNLDEYYEEFINNYEKERHKCIRTKKPVKQHHCHFYGIWVGNIDECIRLTHHAEGLYENTNFEYVHVEVCVDGKWYGRRE